MEKFREELIKFLVSRFGPDTPYSEKELREMDMRELKNLAFMDDGDIELY